MCIKHLKLESTRRFVLYLYIYLKNAFKNHKYNILCKSLFSIHLSIFLYNVYIKINI